MELNSDSLNSYSKNLANLPSCKIVDSAKKEINNAFEIRKAINGGKKDEIDSVYKTLHLSIEQNKVLKLIIDNNFDYLSLNPNHNELSLSDLKYKLDSINNENKDKKTSIEKSEINKHDKKKDIQQHNPVQIIDKKKSEIGKYTDAEFFKTFKAANKKKDLDNFVEEKMTQNQKDWLQIIRSHNSLIKMENKEKFSDSELKNKINEYK